MGMKKARKETRARSQALSSGSGSGYQHDRECEVLTFLYMMGRVFKVLTGEEVRLVVEKVADDPKWLDASRKLEDRICACGLGVFVQHGSVNGETLQKFGENMGILMQGLFGKEKGEELLARIMRDDIQDHGDDD